MPNRTFRTQTEQAAYALGLQDPKPPDGEPLTLGQVRGMTTEEVAARLPESQRGAPAPGARRRR